MFTELTWERSYPWVIGFLIGLLCWLAVPYWVYVKAADRLIDPLITVSAIAIGFALTVTTMLASLERRAVIKELRGIGMYDTLLEYLKAAMYTWFLVALASIVVALIPTALLIPKTDIPVLQVAVTVWVTLAAFGVLTSYRVAGVMFAILRTPDRAQNHHRKNAGGREDRSAALSTS